ncbi:Aldehyde dehydrogenase [Hypsizygus marmoreus]|uniref:Aldehyde dehydrogenase n=1 Tax=Hypsizygus marmoreus TaxID=39966 RepID=A0A369KEH5_HYPMA|nr:Aldehyde dehydrogenase [Hypsizygus marmoreus]
MVATFTHEWNTPAYKGKASFPVGLFIDGKFVDGSNKTEIEVINPATGKVITKVAEGTDKDVDIAVIAAQKAVDTVWGLNASGAHRATLLNKLAALMEQNKDELSALEALDNGKTFGWAKGTDVTFAIEVIKYYAGWADKITGQTIETDEKKLIYTRHEPIGVVGQILPWNFPILLFTWKIGPALATGNAIVMKSSEFTPLTAIRMAGLIHEAGYPPGVVNIVTGYGNTVGAAISSHPNIEKVSFTGSTLVGRKVMEAAAKSNLKQVTLELGGKSPNIVFDDADLDQAVAWSVHGIFWNHGQACCAGSRIFVQAGIYDEFLKRFTEQAAAIKVGDPFGADTDQGPQVSQIQYDRVMDYINSGKQEGATVHYGGERYGEEGYFIQPTIFTDTKPNMRIVKEEIFGPVGVVIKFEDEEDVLRQANDTVYGLAAAVFSLNINRALETAHKLRAGTAWVNCVNQLHPNVPFGGYKQSGIGRELGEYALYHYTNVKAVHVNLGHKK